MSATQAGGDAVSGTYCEAYGKDCYNLQDGELQGDRLTFTYSFSGFTVSGDFTLSADQQSLVGALFSTKCSCSIPVTLHRVP